MTTLAGRSLGLLAAALFIASMLAPPADAVPSFARQENVSCSTCHTAWPMLNSFGRKFKEQGYQVMRGEPGDDMKISDELHLPEHLPFSLVLDMRPYDKKKNGEAKLRALHEVEILAAGNFGGWVSFFTELEAEDEPDGGDTTNFDFEVPIGVVGIHFNEFFNITLGKSVAFFSDPYNLLNGSRKFTRARSRMLDKGRNNTLRTGLQNVEVSGRAGQVFYSVGLGADNHGDSSGGFEGDGPDVYSARVAADVIKKELSVGAFYLDGKTDDTRLDYQRWGVDFQGQLNDFNYQGAYMRLEDDVSSTVEEQNDLYLIELFYTCRSEMWDKLPIPVAQVVPFVRLERWEQSDGDDERTDLILNLQAYFTDNFRGSLEYFQTLDGPDDRRLTFFLKLGI
ncbi:MAG: porin [Candidatus Binatia bacterium]